MSEIKIIVAAHKPYRIPNDPIYLPVQVGAAGKDSIGFQRDDEGENISEKNYSYCELTGLYWAWKNLKADYIGLAHYRRHFCLEKNADKFSCVLRSEQAEQLCSQHPVIVANKRRYFIESIYSHYVHSHKAEGIDALIALIEAEYPDYASACYAVMKRTWAHMFNMFIMRQDILDAYCSWLFEVLGKLETKVDISSWNSSEQRIYGYMGEFMLDIYLQTHHIPVKEVRVLFMEDQSMVKKAFAAAKRKFFKSSRGLND